MPIRALFALLLLCYHVCTVLKDVNYYKHSLFHIRWYTSVTYYYANDFASEIAPQTNEVLNKILDGTRLTHYHASGKYKGATFKLKVYG